MYEDYYRVEPHGDPVEVARKLATRFREDLFDLQALPEIDAHSDDVTHVLLGCIWHTTMLIMVDMVLSMPDHVPGPVRDNVSAVVDRQFHQLARRVVRTQRPLGPSDRCRR